MSQATPRSGKPRAKVTTFVRALLILLLLPQLAALWVLNRPSSTQLPAGAISWLIDVAGGEITAECERVTLDRNGQIRLQGLALADPTLGILFSGEAKWVPHWRGLLTPTWLGQLNVRGRLSVGPAQEALADDLLLRVEASDRLRASLAARAGNLYVRTTLSDAAELATPVPQGSESAWDSSGDWLTWARTLRSLGGGVELTITEERLQLAVAARAEPGQDPSGVFKLGTLQADLNFRKQEWLGQATLKDSQFGNWQVGMLHAGINPAGIKVYTSEVSWEALKGIALVAEGKLDQEIKFKVEGSAGASRLSAQIKSLGTNEWELSAVSGQLHAEQLLRVAHWARLLANLDLDFTGALEFTDGQITLGAQGAVKEARGTIAVTGLGWGDIRTALIRPEQPQAAVSANVQFNRDGSFAAEALDIAGLKGSISGNLGLGKSYVIRLASSPGQPVHPSCLNSLLGEWWISLWQRFDLSSSQTRPHADVVVKGRWGELEIDQVYVGASLERFGFMGARFLETRLRVDANRQATVVSIDKLTGELEGKDAGTVTGSLRWDWTTKNLLPEIQLAGDLHPSCALRLQDAKLAEQLRGSEWGSPWTEFTLKPTGWMQVRLKTLGASRVLGVPFGPSQLQVTLEPGEQVPAEIKLDGKWAGGEVGLTLHGNLRDQHRISRLTLKDIKLAELPRALPGWPAAPNPSEPSKALFSGQLNQGVVNFLDPKAIQGKGSFRLDDPNLKRIRLLGGISRGLDALGIGLSNYQLTEALGSFAVDDRVLNFEELTLSGEEAELRLKGQINLKNSLISMDGSFVIKDSPWGILGYLNPNRLITKALRIKVRGPLDNPDAKVRPDF